LGLYGGNGDGVTDVFRFASARKIVCRACEALKYRAYGRSPSKAFDQFIGDVSGFKVWEDQRICSACYLTARGFSLGNQWHKRGVSLKFSVDEEMRSAGARSSCRFNDLINESVACASLSGKRKHSNARLCFEHRAGGEGGSHCDFRKFRCGRIYHHPTVSEYERSTLAEGRGRDDHKKEAGNDLQTRRGTYAL
jgi:hypothetical protein